MNTMMTPDRMTSMGMGMPMASMPGMMNMGGMGMMPGAMVPRCAIKMERMAGGMKMTCTCDDEMSAAMLQNLCSMMAGGMCGCCMMMNGMMLCQCNMMMGVCKMEPMPMGMMMTCTSGDANCAKMIQACCDCMTAMMMPGCMCCITMNGMPMCCMVM